MLCLHAYLDILKMEKFNIPKNEQLLSVVSLSVSRVNALERQSTDTEMWSENSKSKTNYSYYGRTILTCLLIFVFILAFQVILNWLLLLVKVANGDIFVKRNKKITKIRSFIVYFYNLRKKCQENLKSKIQQKLPLRNRVSRMFAYKIL